MITSFASPLTGPEVPADHARGAASTSKGVGESTCTVRRSLRHPGNRGLQYSNPTFDSPHSFIVFTAHSPAAFAPGDPVRRGPWTSVSQLAIDITCPLVHSSW